VVGWGAAGIGAAGAAKQADPAATIRVFTEFEDVGYSPCGIPYVHGREIDGFERLILQGKEFYESAGIDVRYETTVAALDLPAREVVVEGGERVGYDRLVVATGFEYADPGVPGADLEGLHYVKNIRRAMEWDPILDKAKTAVVVEASPLGLEMTTALAHRGLETHLVDPHPWALSEVADPDIMKPVQDSWTEMGVQMHFNAKLEAFLGEKGGAVRGVRTSEGEIAADVVVVCTHKEPNNRLAREAGLEIGSTGGIVVDGRMATSAGGALA